MPPNDEREELVLMASRWSANQKEAFAAVVAVTYGLLSFWKPETRELGYAVVSLADPEIGVLIFANDPDDGFLLTKRGERLVASQAIIGILRRGSRQC